MNQEQNESEAKNIGGSEQNNNFLRKDKKNIMFHVSWDRRTQNFSKNFGFFRLLTAMDPKSIALMTAVTAKLRI